VTDHPNSDICRWPGGPHACEEDPKGCFPCKLRGWSEGGFQISPAATPSKERRVHPPGVPKGNNSWERPVVTDSRGMPLLRPDGELIRQKEYSENRSAIEAGRRQNHNGPPPPS